MKKLHKIFLYSSVLILHSSLAFAQQSDSVKTLFKSFPNNLRWQWEEGFGMFSFKDAVLMGTSTDLLGVVYKDNLHLAIGVEEAGDNEYLNPYFLNPNTYGGNNSHAGYYILAEPIFWQQHLLQLSVPIKVMYVQNIGGTKNNFTDGFSADPGLSASVNLFRYLAFGLNANYRISFNNITNESNSVLSNHTYTLLAYLRITI